MPTSAIRIAADASMSGSVATAPTYNAVSAWQFITVPIAEWQAAFDEMEVALPVAAAVCPHCGATNLFPGFSQMIAFSCVECGKPSNLGQGEGE